MAPQVLLDCKVYLGQYDLSGQHNEITLDHGAEILDETVFGSGRTRKHKAGLSTVAISGGIFWDDTTDLALFNRIGADREVITLAPDGDVEGDRVFFTRGVNGTYDPISGAIGELLSAELSAASANTPLVRGVMSVPRTSLSATGTSTGIELGAVSATQRLYAAVHVFDVVTPGTLDVIIQSDTAGFASPVTALTFTQITAESAQWQEVAGAIADTWFRASYTIGGGGEFDFAVVIGIR